MNSFSWRLQKLEVWDKVDFNSTIISLDNGVLLKSIDEHIRVEAYFWEKDDNRYYVVWDNAFKMTTLNTVKEIWNNYYDFCLPVRECKKINYWFFKFYLNILMKLEWNCKKQKMKLLKCLSGYEVVIA